MSEPGHAGESVAPTPRRAGASPQVMLLSPFFHPEPISTGRYNTSLAQELVRAGWSVTVACSHPLYPQWKPIASDDALPGIRILRGGLHVRYPRSMLLRRAVLELWFAGHVLQTAWGLRGRVDAVVAVFPPSLAAALALAFARVPWVGIVHDLQGAYVDPSSSLLQRALAGLVHAVERFAFKRCRTLVFLSDAMRRVSIESYALEPGRCTLMYPGHNVDDSAAEHAATARLFEGDRRHVVYSGALGHKQDPEGLIRLLTGLAQRRPDVVCHVFSAGPVFEDLRARGGPQLRFHDLVPDAALPTVLARSTLQVIHEVPGASQGSLPSKLANLLWMAVPIFCACDAGSDLARLVADSGIGLVDSSFDDAHRIAALSAFVDVAAARSREEDRRRLRPQVEELFSFRRLTEALATPAPSTEPAK